jgi:hypothetical protein
VQLSDGAEATWPPRIGFAALEAPARSCALPALPPHHAPAAHLRLTPRSPPQVVWDESASVLVLGGKTNETGEEVYLNDVWESKDGATWRRHAPRLAAPPTAPGYPPPPPLRGRDAAP